MKTEAAYAIVSVPGTAPGYTQQTPDGLMGKCSLTVFRSKGGGEKLWRMAASLVGGRQTPQPVPAAPVQVVIRQCIL